MATINETTLHNAARTLFFRLNAAGVPIPLPFDLVTIDADAQFYEPVAARVGTSGLRQAGQVTGAVYLKRLEGVPVASAGGTPVFLYPGI